MPPSEPTARNNAHERLGTHAVRLLRTEGHAAVTARRVASEADTTTMTVYSRCGGMPGIAAYVFDAGFAELATLLAAEAAEQDPEESLLRTCRVYRRFALGEPAWYAAMFERTMPLPEEHSSSSAAATFEHLRSRTASVLEVPADHPLAHPAAVGVWALCHGLVTLELSGMGAPGEALERSTAFDQAIATHVRGLRGRPRQEAS